MIELELKFSVDSPGRLRTQLLQMGATFNGVTQQQDAYFDHPLHQLAEKDHALRVRNAGGSYWLTWKGPNLDESTNEKAKIRSESEVKLASEADASNLADVLKSLGFCLVANVVKDRESGTCSFKGKEIAVFLDHVVGIGDFIELECVLPKREDAEQTAMRLVKQDLLTMSRTLGLANPISTSYLELLLDAQAG